MYDNFLINSLPESDRKAIDNMSEEYLISKMDQLDEEWELTQLPAIKKADRDWKQTDCDNKSGAYKELFKKLKGALACALTKDYAMRASLKENYTGNNLLFNFIFVLADILRDPDNGEQSNLASKEYQTFINSGSKFNTTKGKSLWKLFFTPVLFAVIWYGLYLLFTAPFTADFLSSPILDNVAYVVLVILFFVFFFFISRPKIGLIMAAVLSFILDAAYAMLAIMVFGNLIKFIPGIAEATKNTGEYAHILGLTVFLILLFFTYLYVESAIIDNFGALGKCGKMRAMRRRMRKNVNGLQDERDFYGVVLEITLLCEDHIRRGISLPQSEHAKVPDDPENLKRVVFVSEYFGELCDAYDNGKEILES